MNPPGNLDVETDAIQQVFPWNKDGAESAQQSQEVAQQGFATPDDPESPLQSLAMLTSMLGSKRCSSALVPADVRDLVKKEVKVGTVQLNESFLLRLNDLNAVSSAFMKQLAEKKTVQSRDARDAPERSDEKLLDDFLQYIFRKGMAALLNFLKALHEEGKNAVVKNILELIKKRRYLEEPREIPHSAVDSGGNGHLPDSSINMVDVNLKKGRLHKGERIYKMQSKPKGFVLLINNENFGESADETKFKFRAGTHVDGDRLKNLFTELGFSLYQNKQFWDLSSKKMKELIEEFSRFKEHEGVDSAVVVVLSHGDDHGMIAGSDGEHITDQEIRDYFIAPNCPHLANKPKIFLFVACRGRTYDSGHLVPAADGSKSPGAGDSVFADSLPFRLSETAKDPIPGVKYKKIPSHADFFVIYATVPGHVSLRDPRSGTWFVDDFVNVVAEEAHMNDLAAMVCEVNNRISERITPQMEKQSLHVITTLRKNLFLNPGF